jgi:hypothetical protein
MKEAVYPMQLDLQPAMNGCVLQDLLNLEKNPRSWTTIPEDRLHFRR